MHALTHTHPTHHTHSRRPQINKEPYGTGWMIKIEVGDSGEVATLRDADAYKAHCDK